MTDVFSITGRDLSPSSVGGTWLALNLRGRLAVLLNIFELNNRPNAISRGQLVENFVKDNISPQDYVQGLHNVYNGFKLITVTIRLNIQFITIPCKIIYICFLSNLILETHFFTNVVQDEGPAIKQLPNGVYGFGNGPYIKVSEGKKRFKDIVKEYGHSDTKEKLIEELLALLKWNKL